MSSTDSSPLSDAGPLGRRLAYPITDVQFRRLGALLQEAHAIAAAIRDSGPVACRFEASNIVAGLGDVNELWCDALSAFREAQA